MNQLRVLLGLVLLAGAYVLAIAVVLLNVGIAAAPILVGLVWPVFFVELHAIIVPLAMISVANVIAIGSAVVAAGRKTAEPWPSVRIPAGDAPELMALISGIAVSSRAPMPAELRLMTEANAAVTENPRVFGFGPATRRLYLGLPILMGMSGPQLKAILSHEIGHYAGGHSRFGAVVHRGAISLAVVCAALRMLQAGDPEASRGAVRKVAVAIQREYAALDYKIFASYAWLYNRVFFFVRRAQEYEADRIAAKAVGGAELAGALRRVYAVSAAWSDFQNRFLRPMRDVRCVPDDPFDAFRRMLADPGYQAALREWEASPPQQPAASLDSHPCLADRLVRLSDAADAGRDGAPRGDAGPGPAAALLPVLPDRPWIPRLTETMSGTAAVDSLPWDECVNRLGQARAARFAERLLRAVAVVSPVGTAGGPVGTAGGGALTAAGEPTLGHVLDLIQTRRVELAAAFALAGLGAWAGEGVGRARRPGREDPLTPLATGLFALLGCLLVATGRVRWQAAWHAGGDPLRLAADDVADAGVEQIRDRVNSFVADGSAANADSVSLHLLSLGVDPNAPVRLTFTGPGPGPGPGAAPATVPRPGAPGSAASGATMVIYPAVEQRDRVYPVVLGIGIVATLILSGVSGAVSRNHAQDPQLSTPIEPSPSYTQPAVALPSYPLPTLPRPSLALPSPPFRFLLPTSIFMPLTVQDCEVLAATGGSCTVITVQPGDTLSLLACRYRTSVRALQEVNALGTSTMIKAGQRLAVLDPKQGPAACG